MHDLSDPDLARLEAAVRDSWQRKSGELLKSPIVVRKIPLTEALLELARAGSGVAIMDRWIVGHEPREGLVALPLAPEGRRTFHAVWRKANPRKLPMLELVKLIREAGERRATPTLEVSTKPRRSRTSPPRSRSGGR